VVEVILSVYNILFSIQDQDVVVVVGSPLSGKQTLINSLISSLDSSKRAKKANELALSADTLHLAR